MAKDKERQINPAAAQRKADKAKTLKKGKAAVAAQRTERLAHRNPTTLQRQIDDLKALEASSGSLSARDKKALEQLETDVGRIRKAKESVGDKYAERRAKEYSMGDGARGGKGGRDIGRRGVGSVLGKRGREEGRLKREEMREGSESETDEDVRRIPMPRDTPPPVPRAARPQQDRRPDRPQYGSSANAMPLGEGRGGGEREVHALPEKPAFVGETKTVYEAKPVVRDLRKDAVGFVPSVVRRKIEAVKGKGGLIEEEELEKLERAGYGLPGGAKKKDVDEVEKMDGGEREGVGGSEEDALKLLEEEEERFRREMKMVQIEEVEDDGEN